MFDMVGGDLECQFRVSIEQFEEMINEKGRYVRFGGIVAFNHELLTMLLTYLNDISKGILIKY